jgi:hypothetical protein
MAVAALAAAMTGALVMVGTVIVCGIAIDGDFSHLTSPISALGAEGASTRVPYSAALLLTGVLTLVTAWCWWRLAWFRGVAVVLWTVAIGLAIAALPLFPCSSGCPVPFTDDAASADSLHFAVTLPIFVGAAVFGLLGWCRAPRGDRFRQRSAAIAIAAVASTAAFILVQAARSKGSDGHEHAGEWERVLVGLVLVWLLAAAFRQVRVVRAEEAIPPPHR